MSIYIWMTRSATSLMGKPTLTSGTRRTCGYALPWTKGIWSHCQPASTIVSQWMRVYVLSSWHFFGTLNYPKVSCDNIILSSCWFTGHLAELSDIEWWKMSFAELHQSHEAVCRGTGLESPQPPCRPLWNSSEVCGFSVVTPGRRCRSRVDFPWEQKRESWCCLVIAVDFRQQWTSLSDKKNSGSYKEMISRKKSLDTKLYFTLL